MVAGGVFQRIPEPPRRALNIGRDPIQLLALVELVAGAVGATEGAGLEAPWPPTCLALGRGGLR